jgi:hypothetical protein
MQNNTAILAMLEKLNIMLNMIETHPKLILASTQNKAEQLFDNLNSYWHRDD